MPLVRRLRLTARLRMRKLISTAFAEGARERERTRLSGYTRRGVALWSQGEGLGFKRSRLDNQHTRAFEGC